MTEPSMFSCYVFSPHGRVLVIRRALDAPRWPGLWMGSWWGVRAPDQSPEEMLDATVRVGLGVTLSDVSLLCHGSTFDVPVPDEDLIGPVYAAVTHDLPRPDPRVVMDWRWVDWHRLLELVRVAAWTMCPRDADQIPELDRRLSFDSTRTYLAAS
jgi:isopentenyl-diphosphate delta-isomerase